MRCLAVPKVRRRAVSRSQVFHSLLNSYHLVSFFPPAAVADILGDGDEVLLGLAAWSFLKKKALMFLNSAARELSGRTLAPEASTAIVRRRVPDLSVSQAVPTE